jgi:hypothetical protein
MTVRATSASMLPNWSTTVWSSGLRGKRALFLFLVFVGAFLVYNYIQIFPDTVIVSSDPVTSYCSGKADGRGLKQNVISYSLYGNFSDPQHFNRYAGAISYILSNISQVYPGYC